MVSGVLLVKIFKHLCRDAKSRRDLQLITLLDEGWTRSLSNILQIKSVSPKIGITPIALNEWGLLKYSISTTMVTKILSFQPTEQSIGVRSFNPAIATALKSDRLACIVQQIHYMGQNGLGELINGVRWIFNSYRAWQQEMPWLTFWQIRKAFQELRELGVLQFDKLKRSRCNHTGWYLRELE